jgi:hypothetical protein
MNLLSADLTFKVKGSAPSAKGPLCGIQTYIKFVYSSNSNCWDSSYSSSTNHERISKMAITQERLCQVRLTKGRDIGPSRGVPSSIRRRVVPQSTKKALRDSVHECAVRISQMIIAMDKDGDGKVSKVPHRPCPLHASRCEGALHCTCLGVLPSLLCIRRAGRVPGSVREDGQSRDA